MNKSRDYEGFIVGTLLGDSWISQGNQFRCEQVSEELIRLKIAAVEAYTNKPGIVMKTRLRQPGRIGGRQLRSAKRTHSLAQRDSKFAGLHRIMYASGTKQVTPRLLKKLNWSGVAVWLMDDGYMEYVPQNNTRNIRLCTDSYDEYSIRSIQQWFASHGIETKTFWHQRAKGASKTPRVSFNAHNSQKLIARVHRYFLPEFYYKLDMHYLPSTIKSKRCSDEYREAHKFMLQRGTPYSYGEDIV